MQNSQAIAEAERSSNLTFYQREFDPYLIVSSKKSIFCTQSFCGCKPQQNLKCFPAERE